MSGESVLVEFDFKISPYATRGNKPVQFRAAYQENGVQSECTFTAYINIVNGYEEEVEVPNSAPALTMESYQITVDGESVPALYAGEEAILTLRLRNNAKSDVVYKTRAGLSMDTAKIMMALGSSDTAYVRKIEPGEAEEVEFRLAVPNDADSGRTNVTVTLSYENQEVVQATATQTLTIPVKQPMRVTIDNPVVDNPTNLTNEKDISINLPIVNKGRAKIYNVSIDVQGEGLSMAESYYGGDILAGAKLAADIYIKSEKSGAINGQLIVSYEDSDGMQEQQTVNIALDIHDAAAAAIANASVQTQQLEQPKAEGISVRVILLIIGAALVILVAALVILLRRRQRG